jgi:hypothetical protein
MVMASHNIGSSKETGPIMIMASRENVKDLLKKYTWKQPKLAQVDKVMYNWFTPEGGGGGEGEGGGGRRRRKKNMIRPTKTEKATSF